MQKPTTNRKYVVLCLKCIIGMLGDNSLDIFENTHVFTGSRDFEHLAIRDRPHCST